MPNEINFPAINGSDGTTCGVFSYGWTSGCTDDNNVNRGFTQEWFFDGDIGAWVSISVGGTGGGAIIDGFTYGTVTHAAPVMTGSGELRQIAFLDPVTGGLTFDYIKTYDIVNPAEVSYTVNSLSWLGYVGYFPDNTLRNNNQPLTTGVTLCASNTYQYVIGSNSDSSAGWKWYVNRTSSSTSIPSPFAPPPVNDNAEFLIDYIQNLDVYTVGDVAGSNTVDNVPFSIGTHVFSQYNSGNSGEILVDSGNSNGPLIGFTTAGGPLTESFRPTLKHTIVPGVNSDTELDFTSINPSNLQTVKHENWLYFASVMGLDGTVNSMAAVLDIVKATNGAALKQPRTGITGNDQLYGSRVLLDPFIVNAINGNWNTDTKAKEEYDLMRYELNASDFGPGVLNTTSFYPVIVIPTRALPEADLDNISLRRNKFIDGIYQIGTSTSRNGFNIQGVDTVSITNERGFTEEYTIFCSENPAGIGPADPNFKLSYDYRPQP